MPKSALAYVLDNLEGVRRAPHGWRAACPCCQRSGSGMLIWQNRFNDIRCRCDYCDEEDIRNELYLPTLQGPKDDRVK